MKANASAGASANAHNAIVPSLLSDDHDHEAAPDEHPLQRAAFSWAGRMLPAFALFSARIFLLPRALTWSDSIFVPVASLVPLPMTVVTLAVNSLS